MQIFMINIDVQDCKLLLFDIFCILYIVIVIFVSYVYL